MIRREPCSACPYRKDCPSGVWSAEEYLKLPPYDGETFEQPTGAFLCHATPERMCNGWAVVGSSLGHAHDLLGLRLFAMRHPDVELVVPEPFVPMFAAHGEAALHGLRDIERPPPEARAMIERLTRKYPRIAEGSRE